MTTPTRVQLGQLARIARAVIACPDVLKLHPGPTGRIASATHAGRLVGLLVQGRTLLVGVIGRPPATGAEIVEQVRAAALPLAGDRDVTVIVASSGR